MGLDLHFADLLLGDLLHVIRRCGVSANEAALALNSFGSAFNHFRELSFKEDIYLLRIKLSSDKEFIEVAKSLLTYLD